MDVLRPLRAGLFFYEIFRLLLLAIFMLIAPIGGGSAMESSVSVFPYFVYLSANALFPLMALFVWLKPEGYRNYLPLYMAGKIIGVVSFYTWEIFSSRQFLGTGNAAIGLIFLGGTAFLSLADVLSVWGAWTLRNRFRKALEAVPESGGV